MQALDYTTLLHDTTHSMREQSLSREPVAVDRVYRTATGVRYCSKGSGGDFSHEIVRVHDAAFLIATDWYQTLGGELGQAITNGDWIHIQFQVDGSGFEQYPHSDRIEVPARTCMVARYPSSSLIRRSVSLESRSRYVCLFMRPSVLTELVGMPWSSLPSAIDWSGAEESSLFRSFSLPMTAPMLAAVGDIQSCAFTEHARYAYMRAKTIELLATVLHAADESHRRSLEPASSISASDRAKIMAANAIIMDGLEPFCTLRDLARRVGLNRSKLAFGFKEVYGVTVAQHWRDTGLRRAYQRLMHESVSITDLALDLGYSDTYSFSRAFKRSFGLLPSDCRPKARTNNVSTSAH